MTAHALAVEGVHTAGDQLVRRLLHMADRAVGIQGVHLALHGGLILARGLQLMAGSAVLGLAEQILMAGHAARVHGIGQHRRRAGLGSLVGGPGPGLMAVGAALRFGLDVRVGMVAGGAVHAKVLAVLLMPPVLGRQFVMVAGHTAFRRIALGMPRLEGIVQGHAVAAGTGHGLVGRLLQALVVAGGAIFLEQTAVLLMVEDHGTARIVEQDATRGRFLVPRDRARRQQIAGDPRHGQDGRQDGDGKVTFLQCLAPLPKGERDGSLRRPGRQSVMPDRHGGAAAPLPAPQPSPCRSFSMEKAVFRVSAKTRSPMTESAGPKAAFLRLCHGICCKGAGPGPAPRLPTRRNGRPGPPRPVRS